MNNLSSVIPAIRTLVQIDREYIESQ